ncbi:hypothetical protein MIND_00885100 [Mycena indigotica]|uniref:Uncharacterized protein n=1 Tax=Mycena indigotica TaxID=2126181 RepID=A0A8H6SHC1_9AGAR|nr:uncharacterized protein MIND_00885100 [Mycena indigotica]KAF7299359.1 hypothetical protein MIND_00885100 [Mycena indigotica]
MSGRGTVKHHDSSPPVPQQPHNFIMIPILPYNKKLTLGYMRKNQPFHLDELPEEYYPCSGKSDRPPDFVFGFPFRFAKGDQDLTGTAAKLYAMQDKIPDEKFRDRTKYGAARAIAEYVRDSIDGDFIDYINPCPVDTNEDIYLVFRLYASFMPASPRPPDWVAQLAEIAKDILQELGWEDVEEPGWYLDVMSKATENHADYNFGSSWRRY